MEYHDHARTNSFLFKDLGYSKIKGVEGVVHIILIV